MKKLQKKSVSNELGNTSSGIVLFEQKNQFGMQLQQCIVDLTHVPTDIATLITNYVIFTQIEIDRRLARVNEAREKLKKPRELSDQEKKQLHKIIVEELDFRDYDLSLLNFSHQDLRGINLQNSLVINTNFNHANLKGIKWVKIYLEQTIYDNRTKMDTELRKALNSIRKYINNNPKEASVVANAARYLFCMYRFGEAVEGFKKAISLTSKPQSWYYNTLGKALDNLERYEEALLAFDNAINATSKNPRLDKALGYSNKGNTLFNLARRGCDLHLMSEFDIKQCEGVKGNTVILTDKNTAYFIFKDEIVMKDDKPQVVEGIDRQGIILSRSTKPIKYTDSEWKKETIVNESTLKGGHTLARYPEALQAFNNALFYYPQDAEYHERKGDVLFHMKEFDDALKSYSKAIDLLTPKKGKREPILRSQDRARCYSSRAATFQELDRHRKALDAIEEAIKLSPMDTVYLNQKGTILYELQDFLAAVKVYDEVIKLSSTQSIYFYNRGLAFTKIKEFSLAFNDFDQAAKLDCKDKAYINAREKASHKLDFVKKGNALYRQAQYQAAIEQYDQGISIAPDIVDKLKARVLRQLEKHEEVVSDAKSNFNLSDDDDENFFDTDSLTVRYSKLKNYSCSSPSHTEVSDQEDMDVDTFLLSPDYSGPQMDDSPDPLQLNTESYADDIDDQKGLERDLDVPPDESKPAFLDQSTETPDLIAFNQTGLILYDKEKYYINKGKEFYALKQFSEAVGVFDKAIEIKPNSSFYYYKGRSLAQLNQNKEALEAYKAAIDFDSDHSSDDNPCYLYSKGSALYYLEDYKKASIAYQRAIKLNPKNAVYFNSLGNSLCKLEKYDEAVPAYDRAILYDLKNAIYHHNQGIAFLYLGQFENALKAFDRAIAITITIMSEKFEYYLNKGYALHHLDQYEQALKAFDQAISLNQIDARAYRYRGETLLALTIKTYQQASPLEIMPNNLVIDNRLEQLIQLSRQQPFTEDFSIGLAFDSDPDPFQLNQTKLSSEEEVKSEKQSKKRKTHSSPSSDSKGVSVEENLLTRPSKISKADPDYTSTPNLWGEEKRRSAYSSSSSSSSSSASIATSSGMIY